MARAVGVGGVFSRARDPKALSAWYAQHFGIAPADKTSIVFDGPSAAGMTVFAHFPADTQYFGPGPQQAMINLRVDNLDELLAQLAAAGVTIHPKRETIPMGVSRGSSIRKAIVRSCRKRESSDLAEQHEEACQQCQGHRDQAHFHKLPRGDFDVFAAERNQPQNRRQRAGNGEIGPQVDSNQDRMRQQRRVISLLQRGSADQTNR